MSSQRSSSMFAGRSIANVLFGLFVGVITAIWSIQIIRQSFSPEVLPVDVECRPGVVRLIQTLEQARQSAAAREGEQQAVVEFRRIMEPRWRDFPQLKKLCADDPAAAKVLAKLERLRFAEEHAVRYEARDVAFWRREIGRVRDDWSGVSASPPD